MKGPDNDGEASSETSPATKAIQEYRALLSGEISIEEYRLLDSGLKLLEHVRANSRRHDELCESLRPFPGSTPAECNCNELLLKDELRNYVTQFAYDAVTKDRDVKAAALKALRDAVGSLMDPEDQLSCVPPGPERKELERAYAETEEAAQ